MYSEISASPPRQTVSRRRTWHDIVVRRGRISAAHQHRLWLFRSRTIVCIVESLTQATSLLQNLCQLEMLFNTTEDAVLLVAGLCSTFAVVISSLLIRKHLVHFSRPVVQVLCTTMCAVCNVCCALVLFFAHLLDGNMLGSTVVVCRLLGC